MAFCPQQSYSYGDIGLISRNLSEIESRKEVDTSTEFLGFKLKVPIVSAPMEKCTGSEMAIKLANCGSLGFLPRTDDFSTDLDIFRTVYGVQKNVFVSIPANKQARNRFEKFYECGARNFCVDVANGYHVLVKRIVDYIRQQKNIQIVTGNVCSVDGYKWLSDLGVNAVRVGVGNGSVCTTSLMTAIGMGQATLIRDIAKAKSSAQIIADGGIKGPADIIKAIALGADVVMAGKLFAACKESPGAVVKYNNKLWKQYAGQASMIIKKSEDYVEGEDTLIPYYGGVDRLFKSITEGLQSAMSYLNCRSIKELKSLPDEYFVLLSSSAKIERTIHANIV